MFGRILKWLIGKRADNMAANITKLIWKELKLADNETFLGYNKAEFEFKIYTLINEALK